MNTKEILRALGKPKLRKNFNVKRAAVQPNRYGSRALNLILTGPKPGQRHIVAFRTDDIAAVQSLIALGVDLASA